LIKYFFTFKISQYGFQTHRPRPPLNRAIPPIPESRSNESIQSSQSMLTRRPSNGLQLQTVQIIDENNPIDEPVPKQTMTGDDVRKFFFEFLILSSL